jgi:hypothetical protein
VHVFETRDMRRTHLRRHDNIIKRLLIHAGAFNLGLVMRKLLGNGTPRGFQGRLNALLYVTQLLRRVLFIVTTGQRPRSELQTATLHQSVTSHRLPLLCMKLGALLFKYSSARLLVQPSGAPDYQPTTFGQLVRSQL